MSGEELTARAGESTAVISPKVSQPIISEATASHSKVAPSAHPKVAPSAHSKVAPSTHSIGATASRFMGVFSGKSEQSSVKVGRFKKSITDRNITSEEERSLLLKAADMLIAHSKGPNPDPNQDVTLKVESAEPPVAQQRKVRTNRGRALIFLSICLVVGLFVAAGLAIYYSLSQERKKSGDEDGNKSSSFLRGTGVKNSPFLHGSCPPTFDKQGTGCYKVYSEEKTFPEAEESCQSNDAILAELDTEENKFEVDKFLENKQISTFDHKFWIGGSDRTVEGDFIWTHSGQLVDMSREVWYPHEPNNYLGQDCMAIYRGKWDDRPCQELHSYICQLTLPKGSGIGIGASISEIRPMITPYVYLVCRADLRDITSMEILKDQLVIAEAIPQSGASVVGTGLNHAKAVGNVNRGYLKVNFTNPKQTDTGSYWCRANGRTSKGDTTVLKSEELKIDEIELTMRDMIQIMRQQKVENVKLLSEVTILKTKIASQESELVAQKSNLSALRSDLGHVEKGHVRCDKEHVTWNNSIKYRKVGYMSPTFNTITFSKPYQKAPFVIYSANFIQRMAPGNDTSFNARTYNITRFTFGLACQARFEAQIRGFGVDWWSYPRIE